MHLRPHHITMQRHLDQLRQQEQNTLNFLNRGWWRSTLRRYSRPQHKRKFLPQCKSLNQVTLFTPDASCATGPSTGTSLDSPGQEKKDLLHLQSLGQNTTRSTSPAPTLPCGKEYEPRSPEHDTDIKIGSSPQSSWDSDENRGLCKTYEKFLKRTEVAMGMLRLQQTTEEEITTNSDTQASQTDTHSEAPKFYQQEWNLLPSSQIPLSLRLSSPLASSGYP